MKICICDSLEERRFIKKEIIAGYFAEKDADCEINIFSSGEALLVSDCIKETDVFIIDTSVGDTVGIDVVRELKEQNRNKLYVLTSDGYEYLDEAMDLGVIRYILNESEKECYYSALDKAIDDINHFIVKIKGQNGNLYFLHLNEIVCVEAKSRKTRILTTGGIINSNLSITKMKELLDTPIFINPHYSFVVNSNFISHIEGKDILVKVNYHYFRIPIAAKKVSVIRKQLINV